MDEVISRSPIDVVVADYVRLQKAGNSLKGLCPFHSERSPSFNVTPDKGVFYCFGCQKGGNVVSFLMEIEKCTFKEAIETLAERFGIPLQYENSGDAQAEDEASKLRTALYGLYERLAKTFRYFLAEHDSGKKAAAYLRGRGVEDAVAERFQLGYAPARRQWLHAFLVSKGYSPEFLQNSGLFSRTNPRSAVFADRLMFPISDTRGRVVAFGGRILEGEGPKYLNSPETPIFSKHATLYGYSLAAPDIRKKKNAIVCEGYMDVIAYHRAGLTEAVAPLGTAFTPAQASLLKRQAETVVFAFDSDEAGLAATEKALLIAEREGVDARVLTLQGGKDAAEILEKDGPGQLHKSLDFTINAHEFMVRRASSRFDPGNPAERAKAVAFLFPYLDALRFDVRRDDCIDLAAAALRADKAAIRYDFERFRSGNREPAAGQRPDETKGLVTGLDLQVMAAAAIHTDRFPYLRSVIGLDDLEDRAARDVFLALEEAFRRDESGLDAVLARIMDESVRAFLLEKTAKGEFGINLDRWIRESCLRIRARTLKRRRERVVARLSSGGGTDRDGEQTTDDLIYESMYLNSELSAVEAELARLKDVSNERS